MPLKPSCQFIGTKGHENNSPSPHPLPSREGQKGEDLLSVPSPLVGESEGEGYFRDKCYVLPEL